MSEMNEKEGMDKNNNEKDKINEDLSKEFYRDKFEKEYSLFVTWLNMPNIYKLKTPQELKNMGLDNDLIDLVAIKNLKEFSSKIGVTIQTLHKWREEAKNSGHYKRKFKEWAKDLTPNVVGKLYEQIMKEGDAARIKLWKEFIEEEGDKLSIDASLAKILKNMEEDGEKL